MEKVGRQKGVEARLYCVKMVLTAKGSIRVENGIISSMWPQSSLTCTSVAALLLLFHLAVNVIKRLLIGATTETAASPDAPMPHFRCFSCSLNTVVCLHPPHTCSLKCTANNFVHLQMRLAKPLPRTHWSSN